MDGIIGLLGVALGFALGVGFHEYNVFKIKKSLALAIKTEIASLFELADNTRILQFIDGDFQGTIDYKIHVHFDYFTIYHSNSYLLPTLGTSVSTNIVSFYNHAKQILEYLYLFQDLSSGDKKDNTEDLLRDLHKRMKENLARVRGLQREIEYQVERIQDSGFLCIFS
jgi:hypothetical protein